MGSSRSNRAAFGTDGVNVAFEASVGGDASTASASRGDDCIRRDARRDNFGGGVGGVDEGVGSRDTAVLSDISGSSLGAGGWVLAATSITGT